MTQPKPHLISFDLCPYVQRSVMTLQEKNVAFDITYIDLANKPDWFLEISPLGKVPVLKIGEEVLFESAVINEYLDEVYGEEPLMPQEPLLKAKNRAWIEFGSQLLMAQYRLGNATTQAEAEDAEQDLLHKLGRLENALGEGPFFNGEAFSLVDAAYAPFLLRLFCLMEATGSNWLADLPKVRAWQTTLLQRKSTQDSVPQPFQEKYLARLASRGSVLAKQAA